MGSFCEPYEAQTAFIDNKETVMRDLEDDLQRVRQVAMDGLMVLGLVVLLAVEFPL